MASNPLEQFDLNTSTFGFSAIGVENLGATEYTLVTIACDESGSVSSFKSEIEKALKTVVEACRHSPRADNLLLRVITFGNSLKELHGFKPLQDCAPDAYLGALNPNGMTALCDASVNAIEAAVLYGTKLTDEDYGCNGILVVVTDGDDNHSTNTPNQAKLLLQKIGADEQLESFVSILIGVNVNDPDISNKLKSFQAAVGFNQYIEIDNATPNVLAKLAKFVSKSISAQSQALGTGGPSKAISF
jgi:hypothetical protein